MANVALNKKIEENWWRRPEELTNGIILEYDDTNGFAEAIWPNILTLDLEKEYEISVIRFLLWDGRGNLANKKSERIYKYRLLVSTDHRNWLVVYDTYDKGYNGWQEFIFNEIIKIRYIRLHCLYNSANTGFHIIEIEAHDELPPLLDAGIPFTKTIFPDNLEIETKDGLPISIKVQSIFEDLEKIQQDNKSILNSERFLDIIQSIKNVYNDIEPIERGIQAIRNQIIVPVKKELVYGNKISRWSIVLGCIAGIIGIISIIVSIISSLDLKSFIKSITSQIF